MRVGCGDRHQAALPGRPAGEKSHPPSLLLCLAHQLFLTRCCLFVKNTVPGITLAKFVNCDSLFAFGPISYEHVLLNCRAALTDGWPQGSRKANQTA